MRKHLLASMLLAGLAACSSDSDPNPAASGPVGDPAGSPLVDTAAAPAAPPRAPGSLSFASLPDRGELLAYGGARKSRQSGAYTYHPVALSEEHALNAIASGEMVLATPDGETLRVGYQSHEEHADGNWTWVGRNDDGSSAVLTFGEKAVFGVVTRRGEQFRIRTDRTGAWVVATDRTRLAPGGARPDKPDSLIPSEDGALVAAGIRHLQKAAPRTSGDPKAGAVVDVLLGYSSGLAQQIGSQSAAQTRMVNLVAAANAAYANSGVNMRLRPVHALQVNYADNSDNEETLQQLTGYDASTRQPITPNSAFSALRAARDEYGADLVAFVRRYQEPEQNGCGIAWLLGMNGTGIQASRDAEFGYAVISDGEDRDEGDGFSYFCSDFSLAHEFGHLMGQAHNSDDAEGRAGVHSYSYGYREVSPTGFFTIMAYPLGDNQVEAPHFANPAVSYQGRPTGNATANNVQSMNQTMPVVSQFRATVVPVLGGARNDVNGDGRSDLIFRSASFGRVAWWQMSGSSVSAKGEGGASAAYTLAATGDFNGDGRTDLAWTNSAGWVVLHLANSTGTGFTSTPVIGTFNPGIWSLVGAGDVDGDGRSDLIFRSASLGRVAWWQLSGTSIVARRESGAGSAYTLSAIGDFNGDGRADLAWTNASGWVVLHLANATGTGFTSTPVIGTFNPGLWRLEAAGDTNGDGRSDLIFRSSALGRVAWWQLNGGSVTGRYESSAGGAYTLAATGDFNGDGRVDLAWVNSSNGWVVFHLANSAGTTYTSTPVVGTFNPGAWSLVSGGK